VARRDALIVDPGSLVSGSLVFGGAPIGGLYAPVTAQAAAGTLAAAGAAGIRDPDDFMA
jgi:hypothetical protein